MTTDRELLELAAKTIWPIHYEQMVESGWNPLTDDGDALRLLVSLAKHDMVRIEIGRAGVSVEFDSSPMFGHVIGDDLNESARRAITRAAAEIGKSL